MSLGWTLRRLGAMGPREVAHRGWIALRDRVAPAPHARGPADEACARLFEGGAAGALATSRLGALCRGVPEPADSVAIAAVADALLARRWRLFSTEVALDDPPQWNADPSSGRRWPDAPSRAIDPRRTDLAGGAKYAWELGRLTALPDLALTTRVTGDPAPAALALRWLDDFARRNPIGHGIHHTSGIEQAIRIVSTSWTLAWLPPPPVASVAPALGLLAQQALSLRDHLSLGSSANNHLIAEYAGMATAGALFPALRGGDALLDQGLAGIEREVLRQFHPDGVPAEQAFGYLPFVWELLLTPLLAAEAAGRRVAGPVADRLRRSLEFARAIRLPDGDAPHVGDLDDGRILLAGLDAPRLDLIGNALAAWLGADALSERSAMARLLTGGARAGRAAADGVHRFDDGGWTVWRDRGRHVTFDHGPLGLGPLAAHGHADALAIAVHDRGAPVVLDPGMPAYHEDPPTRDRYRSTPWHSTVHFGGRSQAEMLGPFLWGRRFTVVADGDGWTCRWPGGERHWRRVDVRADAIVIEDRVHGPAAERTFVLPAGATLDGATARVPLPGGRVATLAVEGGAPRLEPAEWAPRYGVRLPALRLAAPMVSAAATTTIRIGAG